MEGEIGFRFVRDAPPREAPYSHEEIAERVIAFPALEIVATRYRDYKGTPVIERTADCMSNGAYVVGADRPDWQSFDLVNIGVSLTFGDELIVRRNGGHTAGDPLKPAVDLVNALRASTGVRAGQLMTTGTYTGLNFATPGRRIARRVRGLRHGRSRDRLVSPPRPPMRPLVVFTDDSIRARRSTCWRRPARYACCRRIRRSACSSMPVATPWRSWRVSAPSPGR